MEGCSVCTLSALLHQQNAMKCAHITVECEQCRIHPRFTCPQFFCFIIIATFLLFMFHFITLYVWSTVYACTLDEREQQITPSHRIRRRRKSLEMDSWKWRYVCIQFFFSIFFCFICFFFFFVICAIAICVLSAWKCHRRWILFGRSRNANSRKWKNWLSDSAAFVVDIYDFATTNQLRAAKRENETDKVIAVVVACLWLLTEQSEDTCYAWCCFTPSPSLSLSLASSLSQFINKLNWKL